MDEETFAELGMQLLEAVRDIRNDQREITRRVQLMERKLNGPDAAEEQRILREMIAQVTS